MSDESVSNEAFNNWKKLYTANEGIGLPTANFMNTMAAVKEKFPNQGPKPLYLSSIAEGLSRGEQYHKVKLGETNKQLRELGAPEIVEKTFSDYAKEGAVLAGKGIEKAANWYKEWVKGADLAKPEAKPAEAKPKTTPITIEEAPKLLMAPAKKKRGPRNYSSILNEMYEHKDAAVERAMQYVNSHGEAPIEKGDPRLTVTKESVKAAIQNYNARQHVGEYLSGKASYRTPAKK
jgi:hypothetical protein